MKLTDIQYDLVAAYVKEELNGKVLTDFETTLKENKTLRGEVIFQKSIRSALRLDMVEEAMKQAKIDNLLENKTEHPKFEFIRNNMQQARMDNIRQQRRIQAWWVGLAACLIGVGFFGKNIINSHQTNNIIASWEVQFEDSNPYEDVNSINDMEKRIQDAEEQYTEGKWEATLTTLNIISESELPEHVLLAKGQINAQLKNYEKSKELLSLATESEETTIQDDARLALSMVHWRLGEKAEAKKQLAQISSKSKKKEAILMMKEYLWFYPDIETQK